MCEATIFKQHLKSKEEKEFSKESLVSAQSWLMDFFPATWFSRNSNATKFGSYNPSFRTEAKASEMTV